MLGRQQVSNDIPELSVLSSRQKVEGLCLKNPFAGIWLWKLCKNRSWHYLCLREVSAGRGAGYRPAGPETLAMDFALRFACPFQLHQTWMVLVFLAIPSLLAALGAALGQGSGLRIVTATLGSMLRDLGLAVLVSLGTITPDNPRYDVYAGLLLLFCVSSGTALGAVFGPYRGPLLWLLAAMGALAGHWAFGFLPLVFWLHYRRRQSLGIPFN